MVCVRFGHGAIRMSASDLHVNHHVSQEKFHIGKFYIRCPLPDCWMLQFSENPENRNTWKSRFYGGFRNFRNSISEAPDFRESENPDFQVSGFPNVRKYRFPEIRKSRFSDFRGIGCRIFRGIRCRASDVSEPIEETGWLLEFGMSACSKTVMLQNALPPVNTCWRVIWKLLQSAASG